MHFLFPFVFLLSEILEQARAAMEKKQEFFPFFILILYFQVNLRVPQSSRFSYLHPSTSALSCRQHWHFFSASQISNTAMTVLRRISRIIRLGRIAGRSNFNILPSVKTPLDWSRFISLTRITHSQNSSKYIRWPWIKRIISVLIHLGRITRL